MHLEGVWNADDHNILIGDADEKMSFWMYSVLGLTSRLLQGLGQHVATTA